MASPSPKIAVEVPGAPVAAVVEAIEPAADAPPTAEEIAAAIMLLRSRKATVTPLAPAPAPELPDASTVDTSKLEFGERVLTKQGWVLSTKTQVKANG